MFNVPCARENHAFKILLLVYRALNGSEKLLRMLQFKGTIISSLTVTIGPSRYLCMFTMHRDYLSHCIHQWLILTHSYLGQISLETIFKHISIRLFWPNTDFFSLQTIDAIHCRPFIYIIYSNMNKGGVFFNRCVCAFQQALQCECRVLWKQTLTHDVKKAEAHVVEGPSPSCMDVESITISDTHNWNVRRLTKTHYHKFHEEPCSAIMHGTREAVRWIAKDLGNCWRREMGERDWTAPLCKAEKGNFLHTCQLCDI